MRVDQKGRDFTLILNASSTLSETVRASSALVAANETALRLKNSSRSILAKASPYPVELAHDRRSSSRLWNEVAPEKPSARNIGYHISNLLKWWGDKRVADIGTKSCKAYVKTKTEPAATADLKVLKPLSNTGMMNMGPLDAMPYSGGRWGMSRKSDG